MPKTNTLPRWLLPVAVLLLVGAVLLLNVLLQPLLLALSEPRLSLVRDGGRWLQAVLLVDAAILCGLAIWHQRASSGVAPRWVPLWQPAIDADEPGIRSAYFWSILSVIMVAALVLRSLQLNTDLWIDEVLTLVNYVQHPLGQILTDFTDDNQHMLFSLLARISTVVFGESPWTLRLPAMLFGVASIGITAVLARQVFGARVALLSAVVLTVSYHHIWYSQNARGYTMLLFATVWATSVLLTALRYGHWRHWILYAVIMALCTLAHLSAVFVAVAHALVVAALFLVRGVRSADSDSATTGSWRRDAMKPVVAFLLAAWFSLHLFALVVPQIFAFFIGPADAAPSLPTEWKNPLWLVNETLNNLGVSVTLGWAGIAGALLLGLPVLWWYIRRDAVFLALTLVPIVVMGGSMLLLGRNLWPRLFFNLAGFVVVLLVVGAVAIGHYLQRFTRPHSPARTGSRTHSPSAIVPWLPGIALCLVFAMSMPGVYRHPKQDFSSAREFVLQQAAPEDVVVGVHMAGKIYAALHDGQWPVINTLDELNAYRSTSSATWVLYTLPGYLKRARTELYNTLQHEFEPMQKFPGTLGDGIIVVRRFTPDSSADQ